MSRAADADVDQGTEAYAAITPPPPHHFRTPTSPAGELDPEAFGTAFGAAWRAARTPPCRAPQRHPDDEAQPVPAPTPAPAPADTAAALPEASLLAREARQLRPLTAYVTRQQAAEICNYSERTVARWIDEGQLRAYGRRRDRIRREDLERVMAALQDQPQTEDEDVSQEVDRLLNR